MLVTTNRQIPEGTMLGETVSGSYNTFVCSSSYVCVSLVTLIITTVHDKEYGNLHACRWRQQSKNMDRHAAITFSNDVLTKLE